MHAPYLLLDVDGVLIPFPDQAGESPPSHTRHLVRMSQSTDPVRVWLNHHHGPLIAEAIATGLVRPVWATSWRSDARQVLAPLLGLPDFDHVELPRLPITTSHPNGYLWKRDAIATWLVDAPAVWIDDDFTDLDHLWAAERNTAGHPTLLLQPDQHVGLLPEHLLTALEWADEVLQRGAAARGLPRLGSQAWVTDPEDVAPGRWV